jgi:hypothetical protein
LRLSHFRTENRFPLFLKMLHSFAEYPVGHPNDNRNRRIGAAAIFRCDDLPRRIRPPKPGPRDRSLPNLRGLNLG